MNGDDRYLDEAFDNQEDFEELLEVDSNGNIFKPGDAPRTSSRKPSILRDPHGEYEKY